MGLRRARPTRSLTLRDVRVGRHVRGAGGRGASGRGRRRGVDEGQPLGRLATGDPGGHHSWSP